MWATGWLLAAFTLTLDAQEGKDDKKKVEEIDRGVSTRRDIPYDWRGYGRHGLPESRGDGSPVTNFEKDDVRKLVRAPAFTNEEIQQFLKLDLKGKAGSYPIHGGTVYYHVFENTGLHDGDSFETGLSGLEQLFNPGDSRTEGASPRFDRKAKYLYLYQVVNDRSLDPREFAKVIEKPAKDDAVSLAVSVEKTVAKIYRDDIASFSLKIHVDPLYITSWGHFSGAAFAANVHDVNQRDVIRVAQGLAPENTKRKVIPFSANVSILGEIMRPEYRRFARSQPLSKELNNGLGVKNPSKLDLSNTEYDKTLKLASGELTKGGVIFGNWAPGEAKAISFAVDQRLERVEKGAFEPSLVELKTRVNEERLQGPLGPIQGNFLTGNAVTDDDLTTAVFHVEFGKLVKAGTWTNALKNGENSVVFGFTSDLPPVTTRTRLATPRATEISRDIPLNNYFSIEAFERVVAANYRAGANANANPLVDLPLELVADGDIQPVAFQGGAEALGITSLAFAQLTGLTVGDPGFPTPSPPPAPAAPAGNALIGGINSGGNAPGGGGAGLSIPGLGSVGFSRGASGGGGGLAGGGGQQQQPSTGTTTNTGTGNGNTNTNVPLINFNATLINQQAQAQQQGQFQFQGQLQGQSQHNSNHNGHGHGHHGGHGHGHVVPAPASFLLALLGLPGLLLLWRRKPIATPEAVA